jgi:multiple sugar transport system ATP-binding protein
MSHIRLSGITKTFGETTALKDVSVEVQDGEFFVLLGPTGAGKTTTLRVIAGLEKQDAGYVEFDGETVDALAPANRDVAFVFQQYSLYPTMTVYANLAFPLRSPMRKMKKSEIDKRISRTAEVLRITHLLERKTARLSGGEMQRVSLGRALVRNPRVYLMDEPLSNLDAKLRESLRVELKHVQKSQGSTTLFVTHDQIEALTMGDRIGVLNRGRLVQIGSPEDIYDRPATTFVATLVGTPKINLRDATNDGNELWVNGSTVHLPIPEDLHIPSAFLLGVRPEDVRIRPEGEYTGDILLIEPLGVETIVHIRSGETTFVSQVPGVVDLHLGDEVKFDIHRKRMHYFGGDGTRL